MVTSLGQCREPADFRFGNDDDVHRSLGGDVLDREDVVIFVNERCRYLAIQNLGENRGHLIANDISSLALAASVPISGSMTMPGITCEIWDS